MSNFSDKLAYFVKKRNIKIVNLANHCNFDRATMYKIVNGKRNPISIQQVYLISQFLQLSPQENTDFLDAYYSSLFSEEDYVQHKYILDFLLNFKPQKLHCSPVEYVTFNASLMNSSASYELIDGQNAMNAVILQVLGEEASAPDQGITLMIQPGYQYLFDILGSVCNTIGLKITHILCLDNDQSVPAHIAKHNIDCLSCTLSLSINNPNYRVFYYYDHVSSHFNELHPYPFLILTSRYAIACSFNYKSGLCFYEVSTVQRYREFTQSILEHSKELYVRMNSIFDECNFYSSIFANHKTTGSVLQAEACLVPLLNHEMLDKHIKTHIPQRDALLSFLTEYLLSRKQELDESRNLSYFTKSGLEYFLLTGRCNEVSNEFYHPLSPETRIVLLKQMISYAQNGNFRLLRKELQYLNLQLHIGIFHHTLFISCMDNHGELCFITLEESTLVTAFQRFINHLDDYGYLFSIDECIDFLNSMLEKYSTTLS